MNLFAAPPGCETWSEVREPARPANYSELDRLCGEPETQSKCTCCEALRLRCGRLDRARGGEVRRTDPESAHALLVQRSPAVAPVVPDLWSGSVRRSQSP